MTGPPPPVDLSHDDLREQWRTALVAARGGAAAPDPDPYADDLLARWSEGPRCRTNSSPTRPCAARRTAPATGRSWPAETSPPNWRP